MSRNITNVKEMDEILLDKEKYAEQFSEGDEDLKALLFWCWENNFPTLACCCGHGEGESGYVSFRIINKNYDLFFYLYETLKNKKGYNLYIYATHFGVILKGTKNETNFKDLLEIIKGFRPTKSESLKDILKIIENDNKFTSHIRIYPFKNSMSVNLHVIYDLNRASVEEIKKDFLFLK